MKKLLVGLLFVFGMVTGASAQTSYTNVELPFVNAGDHGWVTFYFGHTLNGEPGVTEFIIQCGMHRAELITNAGVYGEQMQSQFFAITCTQSPTTIVDGYPTTTYTLNAVPLSESLVMYPGFWGGPTSSLNLTISSASWTYSGYCGHGRCQGPGTSGGATIAY
jgi:hypothetical protein